MGDDRASILLVDDEEPIRRLLAEHLGESYACVTSGTAEDAARRLSTERFNLLITDLRLPGDQGIELCRLARAVSPQTVVVVMAESVDSQLILQAMRGGAYEFILKPFVAPRVMKKVEQALRRQALLAAENPKQQPDQTGPSFDSSRDEENQDVMQGGYTGRQATLQALAAALAEHNVETQGHSARVVAYCLRLGKTMGLAPEELIALQQGALLHDIGKIGVPDANPLKPGFLSEFERLRRCEHVLQGLRIVDGIDGLAGASPVIGQHHEKFDGSGYPIGLSGESIHIDARIFAVVDAFDSMTSNGPHNAAGSYAQACNEIIAQSGAHFDPKVVEAFLSIDESEWTRLRESAESQPCLAQVNKEGEIGYSIPQSKRPANVVAPPCAASAPISPVNTHQPFTRSA